MEEEPIRSAKRLSDYVRLSIEVGLIKNDSSVAIAYRDFLVEYRKYKQKKIKKKYF